MSKIKKLTNYYLLRTKPLVIKLIIRMSKYFVEYLILIISQTHLKESSEIQFHINFRKILSTLHKVEPWRIQKDLEYKKAVKAAAHKASLTVKFPSLSNSSPFLKRVNHGVAFNFHMPFSLLFQYSPPMQPLPLSTSSFLLRFFGSVL